MEPFHTFGYFYPPQTTIYYFVICADDNAELYLSTDDDPANRKLIARETNYSDPREYDVSSGGNSVGDNEANDHPGWVCPAQ